MVAELVCLLLRARGGMRCYRGEGEGGRVHAQAKDLVSRSRGQLAVATTKPCRPRSPSIGHSEMDFFDRLGKDVEDVNQNRLGRVCVRIEM